MGRNERCDKNNQNMASIYMVQRESNLLTQYSTINEWFEYAHQGIDAVGRRNFPAFKEDMQYQKSSMIDTIKKGKVLERNRNEEIFHLPRLQILVIFGVHRDILT